jgi:hypothetical protein
LTGVDGNGNQHLRCFTVVYLVLSMVVGFLLWSRVWLGGRLMRSQSRRLAREKNYKKNKRTGYL